jgi:DnaK suppressor protein
VAVSHYVPVELPEGYEPSDREDYMNPMQLEYFRQKLLAWREELVEESRKTVEHLRRDVNFEPDLTDRAAREMETSSELRTRDRYRKLMERIEAAIRRIEAGTYGYCDDTGDPIGLRRLQARPVATLCIEAQEKHENFERSHSED